MNVRGVRNIPCETQPDKRAPTVELCESDQQYVPLNEGLNWKGDPNATLSGQGVPQYAPPPVAAVPYDPGTGDYIGPDGKRYTQADLAHPGNRTWQSMLVPPTP
jgi:phospholipid/cholesterol/gamma-HCH transport system substrate-binding protein